jgi:hypothetical protein
MCRKLISSVPISATMSVCGPKTVAEWCSTQQTAVGAQRDFGMRPDAAPGLRLV